MRGPPLPQAGEESRLLVLRLHAVQPQLGGAAVAFEAFAGGLAGGGWGDLGDAALVEPLVGGDLHIGADPEAAGIAAAPMVGRVWLVPEHLSE